MISTIDRHPEQYACDAQATNWADALRAARFFLSIYIHVFCAGLLIIFALSNLLRLSSYMKVPGAILVLVLSTIGLWKAIRSRYIAVHILIELVAILAISVIVFSYLSDYSYDGLYYQLPGAIALEEGWNPFSETTKSIWIDNYPHGIWYLRAAVDVATSGFDLGRIVNVLFCFTSYWSLQYWIAGAIGSRLTVLDRVLIALAAFNPIVIGELLTNLVDGVLCSLSLSLLCYSMLIQKEPGKYALLGAAATCILLVNTKLTGLAFAFIIISGALLMQWIYAGLSFRWIKLEFARMMALAVAGLVSVVLVGYRPYVTNVVDHGAVIYPPFDKILGGAIPPNLRGADHLTKLAHALFAQTASGINGEDSILKWPVQIRLSEFAASTGVSRSGGFGPFFGLFFVSTMACFIRSFLSPTRGQLHREFLTAAGIILFLCIIFPEPWWGRYIPMLPASLILLLVAGRECVCRFVLAIPCLLLIFNIAPFVAKAGWSGYLQTRYIRSALESIAQLTPQRQIKMSNAGRSIDYSRYIEHLLSRRGFNLRYSECNDGDKRLLFFDPIELCVDR